MKNQQAETNKQKSKTVPIILAIFAGILIIAELTLPNFGFSFTIENFWGNAWVLFIYGLGGKLIYDAFKLFRK